jgi:L-aspartate oxidase
MDAYDERGELASRDVVARAIDAELRRTGDRHVVLDPTSIPADVFASRFPATVEGLGERGIDGHARGIPVVPAAHYACGGVRTDLYARTSIPSLYAAGEVACTGVHGANRLASNSLLEAVVFSHRASRAVEEVLRGPALPFGNEWLPGGVALESAMNRTVASVEDDAAVARDRATVRTSCGSRSGSSEATLNSRTRPIAWRP